MRKKLIIAGLAVLAVLVAVRTGVPLYRGHLRRAWKQAALAGLSQRLADSALLTNELTTLRQRVASSPDDETAWFTDRVALMKNGEWIVFANICQKQDRRIADLFLGRGSDGQWYYSTFHFCIGAISLAMSQQPASLAQFRETFFLRTFDGQSDECLGRTWPR
jgi:hypothetical protein